MIIPGEKKELKESLDKARERYGELPKKEISKIKKRVHNKMVRKFKFALLCSTLGISFGAAGLTLGVKALNEPSNNVKMEKEIEQEKEQEKEDFKSQYKVENTPLVKNEQEVQKTVKEEINEMEDKEDLLHYLKNLYIEKYEQKTGDHLLTTEDIEIISKYEDYVYKDNNTGELITHGNKPAETKEKLENAGVDYSSTGEQLHVYKVRNNEGTVIDCVTYKTENKESIPVKVLIGDSYDKKYQSVLADMGKVIPDGIEFYSHFDDELAKNNFIKSMEDYTKNQKELDDDNLQNSI